MLKRISFGSPAPAPVSPLRAVLCEPLGGGDAVTLEWFASGTRLPDRDMIATESVLRGADWLEERWRSGGPVYKHMAIATRAAGLTREEFSRRWRGHGGAVGGIVIPDAARGQAYVQNHVLRGEYDAVNEVYFDNLSDLRARAAWFEDRPADPDLFRSSELMCVHELVIRSLGTIALMLLIAVAFLTPRRVRAQKSSYGLRLRKWVDLS